MARAVCSGDAMSGDPGRPASLRRILATSLGSLPAALLGIAFAVAPVSGRSETSGLPDPAAAPATVGVADPTGAAVSPPALGTTRFKLTPEQQEKLRLAREAEARMLLGLAPDTPIPAESALSEEQKASIRAARESEMRRVLGLGPSDPIPDRSRVTAEQLRKIEAAHEARIRAALGLSADVLLEREPIPAPASMPGAPAPGAPR